MAPEVLVALRLARRHTLLQLSLLVLAIVAVAAVSAPFLPLQDPTRQDLSQVLRPPFWMAGSSPAHLLGTDSLGRDLLSRMVWGSRVSLIVGLGAVALAAVVGVPLGIVAPYV